MAETLAMSLRLEGESFVLTCVLTNRCSVPLVLRRFTPLLDLRIVGPGGARPFPTKLGLFRSPVVRLAPGESSVVSSKIVGIYGFKVPGQYTVAGVYRSKAHGGVKNGEIDDVSATSNVVLMTIPPSAIPPPRAARPGRSTGPVADGGRGSTPVP